MAEAGTLHDAFIDELRDTYDAEKQLTKVLSKLAKRRQIRTAARATSKAVSRMHGRVLQGHPRNSRHTGPYAVLARDRFSKLTATFAIWRTSLGVKSFIPDLRPRLFSEPVQFLGVMLPKRTVPGAEVQSTTRMTVCLLPGDRHFPCFNNNGGSRVG